MTTPESASSARVGDAERDRTVDFLKSAYVDGYLTAGELYERTGRALTARTRSDLAAAEDELPGPAADRALSVAPEGGSAPPQYHADARSRSDHGTTDCDLGVIVSVPALLVLVLVLGGLAYLLICWCR